ncbi:serine/threonine-protein kinase polo [Aphelenchoides avenae]|nr:serine/threonine-protein kinase polo [Aphelenchus avenae]
MTDPKKLKEVPLTVYDELKKRHYNRGNFLGKGGFARCYELIDRRTNHVYAGKVVSKTILLKKSQKDKMAQEIDIHRKLSHPHIVRMEDYFEDNDNVYILLELCPRRSLMELHKRRRQVTEPEARYFTAQIVEGCQYLHAHKIIHRDLKLGNLFLNEEMQVKIGDFGLATIVEQEGERKKTLCGTPNYIAPEMLDKRGHSYEVDIWAVGCILFTLLVGKPPFETASLKDTYNRIRNNQATLYQYMIPQSIGRNAAQLIGKLLAPSPAHRPNALAIMQYAFFTEGYMPTRLPTSCLTMAPKFNTQAVSGGIADSRFVERAVGSPRNDYAGRQMAAVPEQKAVERVKQDASSVMILEKAPGQDDVPRDFYLSTLFAQVSKVLNATQARLIQDPADFVDVEDPAAGPVYWISKWVDYSDKYGLGYQLSDNSVGVLFNDNTKFIMDAAGEQIQYIERDGTEYFHTNSDYPEELQKKVKLIRHFRNYMNENLVTTAANYAVCEGDELARLPSLVTWFRTKSAIVLHLNNGTLQVNFFQDHVKLVLCPLMQAITYIDAHKGFRTFKFDKMEDKGCPRELFPRLKYAKTMIERTMSRGGVSGSSSTASRSQSVGARSSATTTTIGHGAPRTPSLHM